MADRNLLPRRDFGLIVNPNARLAARFLDENRFWQGAIPEANLFVTSCAADLEPAVAELAARKVEVIACLGGDGTFHHLVNAMDAARCQATLLPLAGGTINGLSRAFGLSARPDRLFRRAASAGRMPARQHHTLRLQGAVDRIGFTAAAGLGLAAARTYAALPRRGAAAVMRVVTMAATGRLAFTGPSIAVDPGEGEDVDLAAAGSLAEPFLCFRPFGPAPIAAGTFGLTTLRTNGPGLLLGAWPMLRGVSEDPRIRYRRVVQARMRNCDGVVFDGELYVCDKTVEINFEIGPSFSIISP